MSSEPLRVEGPVIEARGLGKSYRLFDRPADRLKELLWGGRRRWGREFWALRDVDFEIGRGEVVGLVGRNGAGKSTLLQLVCGTLAPSEGTLAVRGRVAALLELGAGFNPDFSGLENVHLNAALLGLSRAEVERRLDAILAFADIGEFVHQPVKTYSSGMFVRLAFAVATSFEPEILVIDEALSVGDGAFARKSFDRIMALKDGGTTILFCSHAMYHVQALCSRALWLQDGRLRMADTAARVTTAYETALVLEGREAAVATPAQAWHRASEPGADGEVAAPAAAEHAGGASGAAASSAAPPRRAAPEGRAVITGIEAQADGHRGTSLAIHSGRSTLQVRIRFASDPALPCPSAAVGINHANGTVVASAGSANDGVVLARDAFGDGEAVLSFPALPLLQGEYTVSVILACERGLHPYEIAEHALRLSVVQQGLERGLVTLPHRWSAGAVGAPGGGQEA